LVDYVGVSRARISVVPNGVPSARFSVPTPAARLATRRTLGLDPDASVALVVGALVPEKGVDAAIDAVARVPGVQLVIVGDGPERASLQARASRDVPERVVFTGQLANAELGYDAADLLLFPSRGGDSMPAAVIEAGLVGLPAIVTDVGALPELVIDGVTGVVVPGRSPDLGAAFAVALGELAADPERREAMGTAAREHCVERYDIDVVAAQWLAVLEGCVGR
jgi:glycosyltransferase involved in cell wall biosynthesis